MTFRRTILLVTALALRAPSARPTAIAGGSPQRSLSISPAPFANDGFKVRDGHWTGTVKKGDRTVVAVNLYAGNEYWFHRRGREEPQILPSASTMRTGSRFRLRSSPKTRKPPPGSRHNQRPVLRLHRRR
jgi:hypothetical protein